MLRESKTLEKTGGEIKNGQPRKTGSIRYTKHRRGQTKQKPKPNKHR